MTQSSSLAKILVTQTGWVYMAKVVTQLFSLLASVLVIRKLPVEVYGTFAFLFGLFALFQLLITSPLNHVITRFLPEMREQGREAVIRHFLSKALRIALWMTLGLLLLLNLTESFWVKWFKVAHFEQYKVVFCVFVLAYSVRLLIEMILMAFLMHRSVAILNMVTYALRSILYLVFLSHLNVFWLLAIEGALMGLWACVALIWYRKHWMNFATHLSDPESYSPRVRRFWFYSMLNELGYGAVGQTSDYFIVSSLGGGYAMGLYGFSVKIYDMFYKILPVKEFDSVLKPLFFKRYAGDQHDLPVIGFYQICVKMMFPIFLFPLLFFHTFGNHIIEWVFGAKYLDAYWPALGILAVLAVNGLFYPLQMVIQLKEQVQLILYSRLILFLSIGGGIWAMQRYGVTGVAFATLAGETAKNLLLYALLRRILPVKYPWKLLFKWGVLVLLMGATTWILPCVGSVAVLFLAAGIWIVAYALLVWRLRVFDSGEVELIQKWMNALRIWQWAKLHLRVEEWKIFRKNNTP